MHLSVQNTSAPITFLTCSTWSCSNMTGITCRQELPVKGAWVVQSVRCLTSAQVMISWTMGSSPVLGSVQTVQSLEPAVSPSLCPSPARALCFCVCVCLSLKDK